MRKLCGLLFIISFAVKSFVLVAPAGAADEGMSEWKAQWNATVQAAEKEGHLVIRAGELFENIFRDFHKRYPKIKVSTWGAQGGGSSSAAQRLLMERRAGLHKLDIWISGVDTATKTVMPAGALASIPDALVLPEVLDKSKWWGNQHYYSDLSRRYVFIYEGSVQSGGISYNTNLVEPKEMKSYWDLLNPKWKGKIVSTDPRRPGTSQQNLRFFYYNRKIGPKFLQRLYGEMDVVISRNDRQIMDWLAVGKYAFGLFIRGAAHNAKKQGLPVDDFFAGQFKEGALVDSTRGALGLMSESPHPNAAKVAVNWFLSREGQQSYQRNFFKGGSSYGGNSMREDISKKDVLLGMQRKKGVNLIFTGRPDWIMNMKPIHQLVDKAIRKSSAR